MSSYILGVGWQTNNLDDALWVKNGRLSSTFLESARGTHFGFQVGKPERASAEHPGRGPLQAHRRDRHLEPSAGGRRPSLRRLGNMALLASASPLDLELFLASPSGGRLAT